MVHIYQLIVDHDPLTPDREPFDLTFDEVREYGESFFAVGFTVNLFLTDGQHWSCVKTKKGWEAVRLDDSELDDDELNYYVEEEEDDEEYEETDDDKDDDDAEGPFLDVRLNTEGLRIGSVESVFPEEPYSFERLLDEILTDANRQAPSGN